MRSIFTIFRWSLIFAAALVVLTFTFQNSQSVTLQFLAWKHDFALFMVVLVAFVAGIGIAGLVSILEVLRAQAKLRKSQRMREMLEREIDALRNQPLYEDQPTSAPPVGSSPQRHLRVEDPPEETADPLPREPTI